MGYIRRTKANATPRWEKPMAEVWGAAWRREVREGCNKEKWEEGRKEFVEKVAADWGIRGLVLGKGKREEGVRKKGEEEEGEEGGSWHYTYHEADRDWEDVGRRCKLVVDSQVTADLLNRQTKCKSERYEPMVRRCHNMQYRTVKAGWKPFQDCDNFLEWRRRRYNKIADHIANESMKHRKSFSYRNKELLHAIKPGNANILVFSDGGAWETDAIASSGWVAFVLGGHWGDDKNEAHFLAAEGIFINSRISAFQAELTAAESALEFISSLS